MVPRKCTISTLSWKEEMELNEILQAFDIFDGEYKRSAIDAAIARREEITPYLIGVLENVLENPGHYADRDCQYFAHIYAFILLGYFKETKSHDIIVDLASLPGDLPSELFGDSITGDLAIILLRTCGGRIDKIKELILNKDAYEYSRGSALHALSYGVFPASQPIIKQPSLVKCLRGKPGCCSKVLPTGYRTGSAAGAVQ
jgi:hypothetical protein